MIGFLGLAAIVIGVVAAIAIAVVGAQLVMGGGDRSRCPRCGATMAQGTDECSVCERPLEEPVAVASEEDGEPRTIQVDESDQPEIDPEVGALNPGVSRTMVRWALIAMGVGFGVRLLGMLDPVGLQVGIPDALIAALTVLGGVAMFLGFIVMDFA